MICPDCGNLLKVVDEIDIKRLDWRFNQAWLEITKDESNNEQGWRRHTTINRICMPHHCEVRKESTDA